MSENPGQIGLTEGELEMMWMQVGDKALASIWFSSPLDGSYPTDAGEETQTSFVRLFPVCMASLSQHVDNIGEEDKAHDGEKHQQQNVHHDGKKLPAMVQMRGGRAQQTALLTVQEIGKNRNLSGRIASQQARPAFLLCPSLAGAALTNEIRSKILV
ncbi:hypothetical protein Q8A73_016030 [Channa argus]|nr:hypothetical protein Q8A73_016030 [Channa argus]